ncbi:hypothetical protein [Plantactinospora alkalitolerans]|uniref:hypothetical protein n=1 Tax=Plantactinospora alkalitolerans TaxID=2789879 RepID=UPI0018ACE04C|nr:hypothetical protein [Plantactinospora alkalitolerans]
MRHRQPGAEVSLTDDGARLFRRATAPHPRAVRAHLVDVLTPEQLEALADILYAPRSHRQPAPSATDPEGERS